MVFCQNPIIKRSNQLNYNCRVFQAEILAIKKVAEMVRELCYGITRPVAIYVNGQAASRAIKSSAIKLRVILDCKKSFLKYVTSSSFVGSQKIAI